MMVSPPTTMSLHNKHKSLLFLIKKISCLNSNTDRKMKEYSCSCQILYKLINFFHCMHTLVSTSRCCKCQRWMLNLVLFFFLVFLVSHFLYNTRKHLILSTTCVDGDKQAYIAITDQTSRYKQTQN